MRAISTANIAYGTQILCIFGALGLVFLWGLGLEGSYGLYALVLGGIFIAVTLCGNYLANGKKLR
jgi:hypothetical protein